MFPELKLYPIGTHIMGTQEVESYSPYNEEGQCDCSGSGGFINALKTATEVIKPHLNGGS